MSLPPLSGCATRYRASMKYARIRQLEKRLINQILRGSENLTKT
jgi:hypothetical protein